MITEIYQITEEDCSIWSTDCICLVRTCEDCIHVRKDVDLFLQEEQEEMVIANRGVFFLIRDNDAPAYVLVMHKLSDQTTLAGKLCVKQVEHLIQAYKTKVDKNTFYQNLLLDNLLLVDIHNQAKKINIDMDLRRCVFVIEPKKEGDSLLLETMKGLYAAGTKDYVTSVDENHIILIKTVECGEGYKELNHIAKTIVDTMNAEAMVDIRVAYGTVVAGLRGVSKSYKEAAMALDVGRVFYKECNILAYNQLGIGRLIHQLPVSLCNMFLKEVFGDSSEELFEEEILSTVKVFFENSLNVSETARKLYIHRNTLVYRLEKIQKMTGLDVRVFDDALTFKIAMMVATHMESIT